MEDHQQQQISNNHRTESSSTTSTNNNTSRERSNNNSEPVRSRWTPKPEQILILESIFNSGMVNPPKEETVRIRKMLEKFGAVGDANVFYWFQNRRSRSRRRQRQLQASLAAATATTPPAPPFSGTPGGGGGDLYDYGNSMMVSTCTTTLPITSTTTISTCFAPSPSSIVGSPCPCNNNTNTTSFGGAGVEDVFATFSGQMVGILPHHQMDSNSSSSPILCSSDNPSNLDFPSGIITIFLNGVATQVPDGPLDMKGMFGEEVILVHSSGVPVAFNEFGISFQSLQHGESYFLVPRLA